MNTVEEKTENGTQTIYLNGHIDSANAADTEAQVKALRAKSTGTKLIIDAEKLEYISSAGLRIILRLRSDNPDMRIINVSSAVYEIFEMTGFSQMIKVEKAYRRLSIAGCEMIGQGSNGNVYRLDPDTIIKVYKNPNSLPEIQRETDLARKALVLGVPTAIPYDVVMVGDGYGSVFELLNAKSLSKLINANPDKLDEYATVYIDILKKIHKTEVTPGDMPDAKAVAVHWSEFLKDYLPEDQYEKLHSLIEEVPYRTTMIHGDYHVKNLMQTDDEMLLIDMDTLSMGHPVFELASMYLAYVGFGELNPGNSETFLGIPYAVAGKFWKKSLQLYLSTEDPEILKSVEEKAMIVGYTRLMRRTIRRVTLEIEEGRKIVDNCKAHLADLLSRIDSLDFENNLNI